MKSVYVAASSEEQNRARAAIERLQAAGIVVTSNWIEVIAPVSGHEFDNDLDAFEFIQKLVRL